MTITVRSKCLCGKTRDRTPDKTANTPLSSLEIWTAMQNTHQKTHLTNKINAPTATRELGTCNVSPSAIHLRGWRWLGGTWRWGTARVYDRWTGLHWMENEVPTPNWTQAPGTQSCTAETVRSDKLYQM